MFIHYERAKRRGRKKKSKGKEAKCAMRGGLDTRDSQPVTHASTNRARRCLTAQIGRDGVCSTRCGPSPTTAVEPESKKGRAAPTDLVCRRDGAPRSAVQCGAIAVHPCRLGKCWQIAAHQRGSGPGTCSSPDAVGDADRDVPLTNVRPAREKEGQQGSKGVQASAALRHAAAGQCLKIAQRPGERRTRGIKKKKGKKKRKKKEGGCKIYK